MSELTQHRTRKLPSERSFGALFSAVFVIVGCWPLLHGGAPRWWAFAVAAALVPITLFAPRILSVPNRMWARLGTFLGFLVSPIVAGLLFLVALTPVALGCRLFGRDALRLKRKLDQDTYWIEREDAHPGTMRNQF